MDTQAQVNQAVQQATQQGNALYNQEQGQISNAQGAFNQGQSNANNAYNQLNAFNANLPNMGEQYGKYLSGAEQQAGFNPSQLMSANENLARTNTTLANLPQAIQQQGGGYGTTAGAEANNYAAQAGGLNSVMQGQTNQVNALGNVYSTLLNQANQQTQAQQAGQNLQGADLQSLYATATNQMSAAGQTLASLQSTAAQQGYYTAQQIKQYQDAYSNYVSAEAAQTAAAAKMKEANAMTQLDQYQMSQKQNAASNNQTSIPNTNQVELFSNPTSQLTQWANDLNQMNNYMKSQGTLGSIASVPTDAVSSILKFLGRL